MSLFTSYFHANIMYVGIQNDISRDRKKKTNDRLPSQAIV